ncbi:bifunctional aspartate kinase/homoserine dehydrogenase II, partial [Xenorhabdus bovienii]|nr:bifunctional aspartate kinase/homoserine dehydrogenase II [Xenorhabdus bovienii]
DSLLKRAQIRPLATGLHADCNLIQLCYTSEVVNSALDVLQDAALPGRLSLREGLSLVALVGAGVCKNPLHSHRFYQQLKDQPVEFIWHAE